MVLYQLSKLLIFKFTYFKPPARQHGLIYSLLFNVSAEETMKIDSEKCVGCVGSPVWAPSPPKAQLAAAQGRQGKRPVAARRDRRSSLPFTVVGEGVQLNPILLCSVLCPCFTHLTQILLLRSTSSQVSQSKKKSSQVSSLLSSSGQASTPASNSRLSPLFVFCLF